MTAPTPATTEGCEMKVYVVMGGHEYESSTILGVYRSKKTANAAVAVAYAHKGLEPKHNGSFNDMTDEDIEAFGRLQNAWREKLPFGSDYDYYDARGYEVQK